MSETEDGPRSPLDAEIQLLLDRLAALEARDVDSRSASIHEIAVDAIRTRLKVLSRKCTDRTCSVRTIEEIRKAVKPE